MNFLFCLGFYFHPSSFVIEQTLFLYSQLVFLAVAVDATFAFLSIE
uniref:Uncharacterized protein n=1 Tax=Rhizophora mucronata TaxID=61149 RepID=A0A2P2QX40_RHIMU